MKSKPAELTECAELEWSEDFRDRGEPAMSNSLESSSNGLSKRAPELSMSKGSVAAELPAV